VAEKFAAVTGMAVWEARLSELDVTHGVTCEGHSVPDTKSGSAVVAVFVLMATIAIVASVGF
jgi:hypothetical protein